MITIKRYPNRKLYNTETKRYITLDGIADLIREGESLEVIDHTTGEDLTTLTLSQIIFEQEKKSSGFLPQSVLTGLIQAGGERLESLRRTLTTPRELLEPVEAEIDRRVHELINRGELAREEGLRLRNKLLNWSWFDPRRSAAATEALESDEPMIAEPLPSAEEIAALSQQVDLLTNKVNALLEQYGHPQADV